MSDYFEIDFLDVDSSKSGDAIALRYQLNGETRIHVVDGGFQDTGEAVEKHINDYYGNPNFIDSVIASHPDGDHTGGLKNILEEFEVGELWMLCPWHYADELIERFSRFTSVKNLIKRLKEIYPSIAALEEIANEKDIEIREPFQGAIIGEFTVMAPTKDRYLDLVVESDKTPESIKEKKDQQTATAAFGGLLRKVATFLRAAWGAETFSPEGTSAENEMSIVQYANLCGKHVLLTADAGRAGLTEAADYAPYAGLSLPCIAHFQVPHHGSRRNVSTEILDRWLGPCLDSQPAKGEEKFIAIISAAKEDEDHPRKAVIRAMVHRGARVFTTEGNSLQVSSCNAPERKEWSTVEPVPYPEEQEE